MSNAKARTPRLGRGLSSLMARAVEVALPPAPGSAPAPGSGVTPVSGTAAGTPAASGSPASAVVEPTATATLDSVGQAPQATLEQSLPEFPPSQMPQARADGLTNIPVTAIRPNPHQPRQRFNETTLQQLADSIRAEGLMQPVIVRPAPPGSSGSDEAVSFELVAGERRWRAAQIAGLTHLPAIIRPLDDRQIAEWALIENLQREDLNPIERAEAFQHLASTFQLSHDQIASRVGIDRSSVSNSLRLLNLCDDARQLVREGLLSAGQAKVLAGLADQQLQRNLAQRTVKQDWSVRQLEQTARLLAAGRLPQASDAPAKAKPGSIHLADLERQIGQQLQTKVHIRPGRKKGAGSLTIEFYSIDQFDAILAKLGVETN